MLTESKRYPNEVVITDVGTIGDESSKASGDNDDDFFSSWDKPAIKRPSNPPSRTGTPPVVSRTSSPFLTTGANGNGSRPKSPLVGSDSASPPPTAVRTGSAIRKAPSSAGAKKGSILGGKKTQKLGAKKIVGGDAIDFEEAERKAKEEAERIEKLGYDPEAEQAEAEAKAKATPAAKLASPTPVSPSRSLSSASRTHERSASEMERLGMGIGRLGFGQVAAKSAPKKPAFGAVAPVKSAVDGMSKILSFTRHLY